MTKCKKCGHELSRDDAWCPACGKWTTFAALPHKKGAPFRPDKLIPYAIFWISFGILTDLFIYVFLNDYFLNRAKMSLIGLGAVFFGIAFLVQYRGVVKGMRSKEPPAADPAAGPGAKSCEYCRRVFSGDPNYCSGCGSKLR